MINEQDNLENELEQDDGDLDAGIPDQPLKYFVIHEDFSMQHVGEFMNPVAVFQQHRPAQEVIWVLDERTAANWAQLVEAHDKPDAYFLLKVLTGEFVYLGDFIDETELYRVYAEREDNPLTGEGQFILISGEQIQPWLGVIQAAGVEYVTPPTE